jgi:hypothetical protein
MAIQYAVTLKNDSAMPWTLYLYQRLPNQSSGSMFSLVWFASPYTMAPQTQMTFRWTLDYGFIWSQCGTLMPGVSFNASGNYPAGVTSNNSTTFSVNNNTPAMSPPTTGNPSGSLIIQCTSNVPDNTYGVGISMSGQGTFVAPAGAYRSQVFTPAQTPSYWIAAGNYVQSGTILDVETIAGQQVIFPDNVYALTYSLGQDNQWTLE